MLKENQSRKRYPSALTDEQWTRVEPLLPPAKPRQRGGRPRKVDLREVLNTIRYLHRSGCQWDRLPHDLLPKSTAYDYFAQWRDDGTWGKVVTALREQTRVAAGREPTPSALSPKKARGRNRPHGMRTAPTSTAKWYSIIVITKCSPTSQKAMTMR